MANKTIKVENEVVKELKEGAEDLDIVKIGVDVPGLVSMINENNIRMYDDEEYTMTMTKIKMANPINLEIVSARILGALESLASGASKNH